MEILVEKNIKFPDVPDSIIQLEGWLEDEGDIYYLEEVKEYYKKDKKVQLFVFEKDRYNLFYKNNKQIN